MTEADYIDYLDSVETFTHIPFDISALILVLKEKGKEWKERGELDRIEERGYLRERYESVFEENSGIYFYDVWDEVVRNGESESVDDAYSCIVDNDVLKEEFERQYLLAEKKIRDVLKELCEEFPSAKDTLYGFNFSEFFINFLNSENFEINKIFARRLRRFYSEIEYRLEDEVEEEGEDESEDF